MNEKWKKIFVLKLVRPTLTFESNIGFPDYFKIKKIWNIFYVNSSLILFSLFYIYNSLNKIYSIIYQDPCVEGASATQRRGFLAYIKLHMIALKLFLVNFFCVFSQLPYLLKLFYWYSVGGLHYWVIFFLILSF